MTTNPTTNKATPNRRKWIGPIIVIVCGVIGLSSFATLALYRLVNGWSSPVVDIDRDVIVTVGDIEPMLDVLPVRLDQERWTKIWRPGNRCTVTYTYDHPDLNRTLRMRSYAYLFSTRRESYEEYKRLTKEKLKEFGSLVSHTEYINRDRELTADDQSMFGCYNLDNRPVAYFFARRRGKNVYIGFIQCDEIDDSSLGEVFAPPLEHLEDWSPSQ